MITKRRERYYYYHYYHYYHYYCTTSSSFSHLSSSLRPDLPPSVFSFGALDRSPPVPDRARLRPVLRGSRDVPWGSSTSSSSLGAPILATEATGV